MKSASLSAMLRNSAPTQPSANKKAAPLAERGFNLQLDRS